MLCHARLKIICVDVKGAETPVAGQILNGAEQFTRSGPVARTVDSAVAELREGCCESQGGMGTAQIDTSQAG